MRGQVRGLRQGAPPRICATPSGVDKGVIAKLPPLVIDQIAAGEVVERPASVIKELLENALDAGAKAVRIEIEGAGLQRMSVIDDGCGMSPEDARLALERHATSKVRAVEDLATIVSFGFRGEALPSIASVARLRVTTRRAQDAQATCLSLRPGVAPELRPAAAAVGTRIDVEQLFETLPARRKFLKSPTAEWSAISEAVQRVALSAPATRFEVWRDAKRLRLAPAGSLEVRVRGWFPKLNLQRLAAETELVAIEAFLAPPEQSRTGMAGLHLFLNGRYVRDRALARAIAFGFGSVLPTGRYPSGVVYLAMPPERVDVNVHPQKLEVRFLEAQALFSAVTRAVAQSVGSLRFALPVADAPVVAESPVREVAALSSAEQSVARVAEGAWRSPRSYAAAPSRPVVQASEPLPFLELASPRPVESGGFSSLRVVGQMRRTYLVCEGPEAMVIIDQHAADERVQYKRISERYREAKLQSQALLFPVTLELSESEVAAAETQSDVLDRLGFDVSALSATTLGLRALPQVARRAEPASLLRDLLDELTLKGERVFGDLVDTSLATMACHSAIRAGDPLTVEEGQALLEALEAAWPFSGHCPHGRPVAFEMSFSTLGRKVGR